MNNRFLIIVIAILGWIGLSFFLQDQQLRKYDITDANKPILEACKSYLSGYNLKFSGGADNFEGCACIAQKAAQDFTPSELPILKEYLKKSIWIAASARTPGTPLELSPNMKRAFQEIQRTNNLTTRQHLNFIEKTPQYIIICGS